MLLPPIRCFKIKNILVILLFYSISTPLKSHQKINPENWMKYLYHKLPETRLRDVLIPGTNNSGSYNITNDSPLLPKASNLFLLNKTIASNWVKTQNLTIFEQLKRGIRYIELNLIKYKGEFFLTDDLISGDLNDVLINLRSWAATHPFEIVFINAKFDFQTLSEAKDLHRRFSKHIGPFLAFPLLPPNRLTFGDLWAKEKGRPLILLTPSSFKKMSPRYWDKKKMLQTSKTNAQNKKVLLDQILYGNEKGPGLYKQDWSKFFISELIFKPNTKTIIKGLFEKSAPKNLLQLSRPLFESSKKSVKYWLQKDLPVNIIKIDFFEKTNLVSTCLEANRKTLIQREKIWY